MVFIGSVLSSLCFVRRLQHFCFLCSDVTFPSLFNQRISLYIQHGSILNFFFIIVHVYSFKVQRNYKDYNRNAASIIPSPLDPSSKSLSTVFQLSLSWYLPPVVETVSCLYNIHPPPLLLTNEISVLLKLTVCPAEKTTFPSFTCKKAWSSRCEISFKICLECSCFAFSSSSFLQPGMQMWWLQLQYLLCDWPERKATESRKSWLWHWAAVHGWTDCFCISYYVNNNNKNKILFFKPLLIAEELHLNQLIDN